MLLKCEVSLYFLLSDLCFTSNATSLPQHHHLFNPLRHLLHLPVYAGLLLFVYALLLLRLYLALSVSLWVSFSVGTGCGSAGSYRILAGRLFLGEGVQRTCCPLLLALVLILELGDGWGLRIRRWF